MKSINFTLLVIGMFIAMLLGLYVYQHANNYPNDLQIATYVNPSRPLKEFALKKTDNTPLNIECMRGRWTILFFGYTQCRSICPTTLDMLHKAYEIMRKDGFINRPELVMVSLDGNRDSLQTMQKYTQGFDQEFKGAVGDKKVIDQLTAELGIVYDAELSSQTDQIDHSGALTLINPAGEVSAFFIPPLTAAAVAHDTEKLITTYINK